VHGTIEAAFRTEWRPLAGLAEIVPDWRALAARALAPNVFYEPAFALAAAPVFGRDVGAGLVWSRATRRLMGFFPARIERRRYGILWPVLVGWTHPYGPLGAPLIDRDAATAVISAWFDHLAGEPECPSMLLLPLVPAEGLLAQAFDCAIARRNGKSISLGLHRRAFLSPGGQRVGYLERAVGARRRKELRRQLNRLSECGALSFDMALAPPDSAPALGDFFALEAGGWKGRAGTAAAGHPDVRDFMRNAISGLSQEGGARIARLRVGGKPVAAIVMLTSGTTAWCWKIAYDEAFARFSPGVQLLVQATRALLDDSDIAQADSCANPNHPMIDHVWRERAALADRLMQLQPRHGFAVAALLETVRRAAIAGAKALRDLARAPSARIRSLRARMTRSQLEQVTPPPSRV
jgi:CelD/BcsL family acetyltransferase involved in cellulose biosynthesis